MKGPGNISAREKPPQAFNHANHSSARHQNHLFNHWDGRVGRGATQEISQPQSGWKLRQFVHVLKGRWKRCFSLGPFRTRPFYSTKPATLWLANIHRRSATRDIFCAALPPFFSTKNPHSFRRKIAVSGLIRPNPGKKIKFVTTSACESSRPPLTSHLYPLNLFVKNMIQTMPAPAPGGYIHPRFPSPLTPLPSILYASPGTPVEFARNHTKSYQIKGRGGTSAGGVCTPFAKRPYRIIPDGDARL